MQCKDIPDEEFLEAIRTTTSLRQMRSAMIWDIQAVLSGYPEHLLADIRDWDHENYLPRKLVLAKARKLVLKGKIDGCYCGCRGDFEIIEENI